MPGPPPDSRAASLPSAQLKKHQFFGKRYFQGADGEVAGGLPMASSHFSRYLVTSLILSLFSLT